MYPGYNFGGSQMGQMPGQLPGMGQQPGQMQPMGGQQQMQPLGMGQMEGGQTPSPYGGSQFDLPSGQFQMNPMLGQNMMQRWQQWRQMFPQYSGMGQSGGWGQMGSQLGALAGWGLHKAGAF